MSIACPSTDKPVLFLVTDAIAPYHHGGKELRYAELAPRLTQDFDVHVMTMKWWDGPRSIHRDGVTYRAICPRIELYRSGRRSILQAVLFSLGCLRLMTARFDVLEADHMPYLQLFPLRLVASLRRRPLTVTWHEVWGPEYWRQYLGQLGVLAWWVERSAMTLPDTIIAASAHTAERLRGVLGSAGAPVWVADNGVDLDGIAAAAPHPTGTDLITVGRLIDHKRVDWLLSALQDLRARGSTPTLRVIGTGPEEQALRSLADRLELTDAVCFDTAVSDPAALYARLKAARLFVLPSAREGFGIAALEALACDLPVITTDAPDNLSRHVVAGSALGTVCPDTVADLAEAIALLLDRPRPVDRAAHRDWLRRYDWSRTTQIVVDALRSSTLTAPSTPNPTTKPPSNNAGTEPRGRRS